MTFSDSVYGIKKTSSLAYEEAINKVKEALMEEGFGVLTEIDVKQTLKKKLDKDFTDYIILGACNPNLAFEALNSEIDIGLLLPCNVVVYKDPTNQSIVVAAVDPEAMIKVTNRKDLDDFSAAVKERLARALNSID